MTKRYPFKFLDAYNPTDTDIFFGRDEEIEALYQMTFQSDILLVYGASGTGKTSLINCGLASRFQAHDWLALNIRRGNGLNASLQQKLEEATAGVTAGAPDLDLSWLDEGEADVAGSALGRQLQEIYRRYFRPIYLIFDQFEELYILGSKAEQAQFIRNVQEIQSVEQPVKMIFVIREEYLGHLFEFERAVPQLLRKKLRVEPMNLDKVGQVVWGAAALSRSNIRLEAGQEVQIVEGIFQKIKGDEQTLAIQLPYLQVFLDKLYLHVTGDEGRQADALFTRQALSEIGDIGDVLRDFLEEQAIRIQKSLRGRHPNLPEDTVWQILSPLATLEGTKEPIMETNLIKRLPSLHAAVVSEGLRLLEQGRILRYDENEGRYEVAHDSLAARIAEHRNDDEIAMLEIQRLITSQMALKAEARALFTEKQLNLIDPYLGKLVLEPEALQLIEESRRWVKARGRRARRRNLIIGSILATAAVVAIFFALRANTQTRIANNALAEAEQKRAQAVRADSLSQIEKVSAIQAKEEATRQAEMAQRSDSLAQAEKGKAIDARNNALRQRSIAQRQADIAEARRLAFIAKQLAGEHLYTDALHVALAAYQRADPQPLETYQAFSSIFKEAIDNSLPVITGELQGHTSDVYSASFSPDGQHILTHSEDRTAKLWDLRGNILADLNEDNISVQSASFSPDGQRIVTGSSKTAKVWDLHGKLRAELNGHTNSVLSASFSPDGQRIVTSSFDRTAKLWDLQGTLLTDFNGHSAGVTSAVFSPDGRRILTVSRDTTAKLWDLHGNLLSDLRGHTDIVRSAVFSPDGRRILTASKDHTAKLWDLQGMLLADFNGHSAGVTSAVFSPDGRRILTASYDKTAKLWDLQGTLLADFNGHSAGVTYAVFSPDGQRILTSSLDDTAILWDLQGKLLADLRGHTDIVRTAVFSPDGRRILTASKDHTAKLWDLQGDLPTDLRGHSAGVTSAVFSPDGQRILTVSLDDTAKLWDLQGKLLADFLGHSAGVTSAVFSPDGQRILTVSLDHTAKLWDLQGRLLANLQGHTERVISVVFSPDGRRILTGSLDDTAKLWDLQGKLLANLQGHTERVTSVVFSPDGRRILTGSGDDTAKLWDLQGNLLADLRGHTAGAFYDVTSAVFSPDGRRILTASRDKTAKLWDLQGNLLANLQGYTAVFSPDGRRILTVSNDITTKLWDLQGNLLVNLQGHTDWVTSAVFSPDGRRILTGSDDHTAKLWDLQGNILADLQGHTASVRSAIFSPDGRRILTGSEDHTAKLWLAPSYYETWVNSMGLAPLTEAKKKEYGLE